MKHTAELILVLVLVVGSWGRAEVVGPVEPVSFEKELALFCSDPFTFACRDFPAFSVERNRMRLQMAQKAATAVSENLRAGMTPEAYTALMSSVALGAEDAAQKSQKKVQLSLERADIRTFMWGFKGYLAELEKHAPVRKIEAKAIIEVYRQLHIERIQAELSFPPKMKEAMIERVKRTEVLLFDDILGYWEKIGLNWERDLQSAVDVISSVSSTCGPDYLRENASMNQVELKVEVLGPDNKKSIKEIPVTVLTICPGAALSAFENIISHEFSHVYDLTFDRPQSFLAAAECIQNNFEKNPGVSWMAQADEKLRAGSFWANVDEFLADLGAAEVKARRLDALGLGGKEGGLRRIKKDLLSYCGEVPGRTHGSGEFRINHIYGANPLLRKAAGCDAAKPGPTTCTLSGRYPANR